MSVHTKVARRAAVALSLMAPVSVAHAASPSTLRVCAPSDNFPMSTRQQTGFENKLAQLAAADLHAKLTYTWWPARENFLDRTLKKGSCDIVVGVPRGMSGIDTTNAYYRSSYVFIARRDGDADIASLSDGRLRQKKIGVYLIGDEQTPPAAALANEGLNANVIGYVSFFDRTSDGRGSGLISELDRGSIDIAAVWGPLAGNYVLHDPALTMRPIEDTARFRPLLFNFDIAMGVRKDETALRTRLNGVLARRKADITALLKQFGVPLLPLRRDLEPHRWATVLKGE